MRAPVPCVRALASLSFPAGIVLTSPNSAAHRPVRRARCSAHVPAIDTREPSERTADTATADPSSPCRRYTRPRANRTAAGSVTWNGAAGNASRAVSAGSDPHPWVRIELLPEPFPSGVLVRLRFRQLDPHHQIGHPVGQEALGRLDDPLRRRVRRLQSHHEPRHGEEASRPGGAQIVVGNQMSGLRLLEIVAPILARPVLRVASLVPGERLAHRRHHPAADMGAPGELRILQTPSGERFVEPAHPLEERTPDPEVPAARDHERGVVPRGELARPRQMAFDERRVRRPVREQLPQRPRPLPDGARIHPVHRDVGVEPLGQEVAGRVVPTGVGREPARLGQHVAVEKEQDVMARGAHPGVARPREPEAAVLLAHHLHVERARAGGFQRRPRPVVDDDHLEEVPRIRLAFERGEGEGERPRRLVVRHDDADRPRGPERPGWRDLDLVPVVVPDDGGRGWRQHGDEQLDSGLGHRPVRKDRTRGPRRLGIWLCHATPASP